MKSNELVNLMREALNKSMELQRYTEDAFSVYYGDDDSAITSVIDNREKLVNDLGALENRTDSAIEDALERGEDVPEAVENIRAAIRKILSEVRERDLEAMQLVSIKMQKYKEETIKARNKKHISDYIMMDISKDTGVTLDFRK